MGLVIAQGKDSEAKDSENSSFLVAVNHEQRLCPWRQVWAGRGVVADEDCCKGHKSERQMKRLHEKL